MKPQNRWIEVIMLSDISDEDLIQLKEITKKIALTTQFSESEIIDDIIWHLKIGYTIEDTKFRVKELCQFLDKHKKLDYT